MLMTPGFTERCNGYSLTPISASALQDVDIPQPDKDFFIHVGLPRKALIPTGGAGDFNLLSDALLLSHYKQRYLRLGFIKYEPEFGHETYFCTEKTAGAVYLLDNQDSEIYYVNSSIPAFAEALLAYRSFIQPDENDLPDENDQPDENDLLKDDDSRRLRRLKREMKAFDLKAMASRTNYWPLMLTDLADQI